MTSSLESLVELIREKTSDNPEASRVWALARAVHSYAAAAQRFRSAKGLSIEELAGKAGCSPQEIIDLENPSADKIPRLELMVAVAQAIDMQLVMRMEPPGSEVALGELNLRLFDSLIGDVHTISGSHPEDSTTSEFIAVVAVDALGHVRLPDNVVVKIDENAHFHVIPMLDEKQ